MGGLDKKMRKGILAALLAVILVGGVAHAVFIDVFNKTEHSSTGPDGTQATYLRFDDRDDSTSTWVKRDYNLNGKTVDLQAQTVDGTLVNNSDDEITSWVATVNITGDCFINNAWTGTVEIHQYVGTAKEKTQTLDLRDYDLADVELEHFYDGDLLIPLTRGDRLVYYPSEKDEVPIAPRAELTMGMIFYYLDDLDLSDYSIGYYYHRDFTYGPGFIVLASLAVLWVLLLAGMMVADASYRRAVRESDLRKSGLSSMSSIYSVISFIDLQNDQLIPVYADVETGEDIPQGSGAKKKLYDIFAQDTTAPFRTAVLNFIDTDTLPDRMKNGSIALEYVSKEYGWSKVRFFPVEDEEGQPLKRVLLTIEDINDEKQELERFEEHSAQVELESNTRSAFVAGVSSGMRPSVQAIDDLAGKIIDESDDESACAYAKQIKNRGKVLSYLIDSAIDSTAHNGDDLTVGLERYEFAEMMADACGIAKTITSNKALTFEIEVSPSIPEYLVGDRRRVERALIGILAYVTHLESATAIKLSAYGAQHEGGEHILFSVKVDGTGLREDESRAYSEFLADIDNYGVHAIDRGVEELEGVALMLMYMGSRLQMVNEPGESLELYFEMEQRMPSVSPVDRGDDEA